MSLFQTTPICLSEELFNATALVEWIATFVTQECRSRASSQEEAS
jgi:hypothetical protein